jgi:hypothetical protein
MSDMKTHLRYAILTGAGVLILTLAVVGQPIAAQKMSKGHVAPSVPEKPSRSSPEAMQKKPLPKSAQPVPPAMPENSASGLRRAKAIPLETIPTGRKPHRAVKTSKKVTPKAVVQPRTDLMHYGVLENAQRYDPRPHAHSPGVPNPQTPELTHDHFQELDRNQDGAIDPVERAFGRIDMDRDLHTRTLQ